VEIAKLFNNIYIVDHYCQTTIHKANGSLKTCLTNHLGYNISGMDDHHPWSPMDYKVYGDECLIIISNAIFDDDIRHLLCPISLWNQIISFKKECERRFKTLRCY
jgi:hypothetical protein